MSNTITKLVKKTDSLEYGASRTVTAPITTTNKNVA